jgi:branched-chain amino acid transport system permease protein
MSDASGGKTVGGGVLLNEVALAQARFPGRAAWILLALLLALGFGLPAVVSSVLMMTLLTQAVISGVLATGVGFLVKQNGAVSFGHAAYYGLSGYTITLLLKYGVVPAEAAIVIALLVPAALAFLLGLVIVRIPGVAFSMLTLAIGQALYEFVVKARHVAGGDDGLAIALPPSLFGTSIRTFQDPHSMFVICWIVLVLVVFGLFLLVRSPFGQLTEAIRENEERARFVGYQTVVPRSLVYALSALIAALAGALFALYNGFVSPDVLHWSLSGSALIMAIIGGPKLLWGPAFGAVIFFFLKNLAGDLTEHWQAMIGVILILVTVLLPTGLAGALVRGGQRLRDKAAA